MTFETFGATTYVLASSIGSTDTTIVLSSFKEPVTNTPYTMALLNTDIVYATIAPKTTNSEFISFTGITQNADGTATLTGVTRGLAKKYPFTADSSYRLPHSGQTQFIISDAPQVFNQYGALQNDEAITGYWTGPDPLTAQGLATMQYVLDVVNGGAVTFDAIVEQGIAGTTIAAGDLLVFDQDNNEWMLADATDIDRTYNCKMGIAMGSGTNGNTITDGVLTRGFYTTSGLTKGDMQYVSDTAGDWANTSGTYVRAIGLAVSTTQMYFDPDFADIRYNFGIDQDSSNANIFLPFVPNWQIYGSDGNEVAVGTTIFFQAATTNSGDATLDINNDARYIRKYGNQTLGAGDIVSGRIYGCVYDGTYWQLITPPNTPSSDATDQSQTTQNATQAVGEADATTRANKLAQSFIPTYPSIGSVQLYKSADTGSFSGTVTISIQADSSGSPSGTALATTTITNAQWLALPTGEFRAIFATEYNRLTPGSLYWIVIQTSTSDTSNHPNLGTNSAGGYANGSAKYNNTTDGWVAIATIDLYFKTKQGIQNKVVLSGSDGYVPKAMTQPMRNRAFIYQGSKALNGATDTVTITHSLGFTPSLVRATSNTGTNDGTNPTGGSSSGAALISAAGAVTSYSYSVHSMIISSGDSLIGGGTDALFYPQSGATTGAGQKVTITKANEDLVELTLSLTGSPAAHTIYYTIEIYL